MGKSTINGSFSIAMLNYQRVTDNYKYNYGFSWKVIISGLIMAGRLGNVYLGWWQWSNKKNRSQTSDLWTCRWPLWVKQRMRSQHVLFVGSLTELLRLTSSTCNFAGGLVDLLHYYSSSASFCRISRRVSSLSHVQFKRTSG